MSKKIIAIFLFFSLVSVLIVACSRDTDSTNSAAANNTASASTPAANASNEEVHLSASTFAQGSITITKGSKLTLVNDTSAFHNVQNGTWVKDAIQPAKENGAPMVKAQINGNDTQAIGPFTVAGTYHLCCVVHPGMNLTVIVQ